jgi:ABC-type branched-subunit amino acid transport system substrate-binding protein
MNLRGKCGGSDLFFRTTSSTRVEAETLVNYLLEQKDQPEVAVFYNSKEFYSKDLFHEFERALQGDRQGTIVKPFDLSETDFNVNDALRQIEDVDALAVLPDGRTGNSEAFDRALEVVMTDASQRLILGSAPLYTADWSNLERRRGLRNRLIIATDWFIKCASPSFGKEADEYWFGGLNRITALSYSTKIIYSNNSQ